MNDADRQPNASGQMPDEYDRQLATLNGLPGSVMTKPSVLRNIPSLGVGGTKMFVVQTCRHDQGETVFLEVVAGEKAIRLVLPPPVTTAINRHHDALTARVRSRAAKASAADRKARGLQPGFMKSRKGGKAK